MPSLAHVGDIGDLLPLGVCARAGDVVHLQEAEGLRHGDADAPAAAGQTESDQVVEGPERSWEYSVLDRHLHGAKLAV